MEEQEARKLIGKFVKLILKNSFIYKGRVIDSDSNSLIIFDKFSEKVFIDLDNIMICTLNGDNTNV